MADVELKRLKLSQLLVNKNKKLKIPIYQRIYCCQKKPL